MTSKKATTPKPTTPKPAPKKNNAFDFDMPDVDSSLLTEKRESYPSAVWHSQYTGDPKESRFWTIDREALSNIPGPAGFWKEDAVRFGNDPNDLPTPVLKAEVMRCVPIAERARQIVTVGKGYGAREHYYGLYTPRDKRIQGDSFSFHYQVLVSLDGLPPDELVVLGLRGFTKTVSWNHDGKRYSDFPVGVKQRLQAYIDNAPDPYNSLPLFYTWIIDLRGHYTDGEPTYIGVGPGGQTFVQPFSVDMNTGGKGYPDTRFVGGEMFQMYQEMYRDIGQPWEKEWDSFEGDDSTSGNGAPTYNRAEPVGDEEDEVDEIPW